MVTETKVMAMFTWSINDQKYGNNINIKKGDQDVNKQQQSAV